MSGYLGLSEFEGNYLIIYRKDESRKPILNPEDIGIIKFYRIRDGRVEISFNGENYGAIRLEALEEGELKKIVDEKIKNLEERMKNLQSKEGLASKLKPKFIGRKGSEGIYKFK